MNEPTTLDGQGKPPWTGFVLIGDTVEHEFAGRVGRVRTRTTLDGMTFYRVEVDGRTECFLHDELSKWQVA